MPIGETSTFFPLTKTLYHGLLDYASTNFKKFKRFICPPSGLLFEPVKSAKFKASAPTAKGNLHRAALRAAA
jgi:hypothetical protein